jgi:hypothetical protein
MDRSACLAIFILCTTVAGAHQVPSMTLETAFAEDGTASFSINLDPRCFLAADPTTLPPVPAEWWRDQSEEDRAKTAADANAFLAKSIRLKFGDKPADLPTFAIRPMDAATNQEFTAESKEVHLLGTLTLPVPAGAENFALEYTQSATIPLVLLNSLTTKPAGRPQILFPGETARPFKLPPPAPVPPPTPPPVPPKPAPAVVAAPAASQWWVWGTAAVLALLGVAILRMRRAAHRRIVGK